MGRLVAVVHLADPRSSNRYYRTQKRPQGAARVDPGVGTKQSAPCRAAFWHFGKLWT
jgi:hypothetical protein